MFELNEVFEKLQTLLEKKGAKLYSFEISESEKRELNTEKTDFNLLRTIYDNNAAVSVILSSKKGTAAGNDLTEEGLEKLVDDAMLSAIRDAGFAITVLNANESEFAEGKYLIIATVDKKQLKVFEDLVKEKDEKAFIMVSDTKSYVGGYFGK